MAFAAPTSELKHVAPEVLLVWRYLRAVKAYPASSVVNVSVSGVQDYLRGAVSRLASSPTLAQRLGQPTADVERAIKSTFEDLCAANSRNGSSSHKLVFRHDCQYVTSYTIFRQTKASQSSRSSSVSWTETLFTLLQKPDLPQPSMSFVLSKSQ